MGERGGEGGGEREGEREEGGDGESLWRSRDHGTFRDTLLLVEHDSQVYPQ